jgi:uncharacterized protein (TIGR02271 family)
VTENENTASHELDSGRIEILPDGSVSIPLLEEQLVVERRMIVRERVVIRKRTVVETARVETELRRERLASELEDPTEDSTQT